MSEYGQVINPQYDPRKNDIYKAFSVYFENPILTKIKNVQNYSVYMTKIHSLLGNAYRYLILFIDNDYQDIGNTKNMDSFEWVSLQTRTLEEQHRLKQHLYTIKKNAPLTQKITVKTQDEKQSVYTCETFPLIVTLLHTRKNSTYQYQPTGTIVSALETFQTIINFDNQ
jgi:hypothetical protein